MSCGASIKKVNFFRHRVRTRIKTLGGSEGFPTKGGRGDPLLIPCSDVNT